jgi:hypothetical protein
LILMSVILDDNAWIMSFWFCDALMMMRNMFTVVSGITAQIISPNHQFCLVLCS